MIPQLLLQNICVTDDHVYVPFIIVTILSYFRRILNKSNTTSVTIEAEIFLLSGEPEFMPFLMKDSNYQI
jgi:adenine deaminase